MTSKYSRVSGFNPLYIAWWIDGCRNPVPVTFPTRRLATSTRQNLYALRSAMERENHHAISLIERGEIIRRPVDPNFTGVDDPHILTIRPVDFDMNTLLEAAGINLPDFNDDGVERPETFDKRPKRPRSFDYASTMKENPTDNNDNEEKRDD